MIRVKSTAWALLASIPLVIHTLVYWRAPISPSAERFFHSLHGHWRGFGGYTDAVPPLVAPSDPAFAQFQIAGMSRAATFLSWLLAQLIGEDILAAWIPAVNLVLSLTLAILLASLLSLLSQVWGARTKASRHTCGYPLSFSIALLIVYMSQIYPLAADVPDSILHQFDNLVKAILSWAKLLPAAMLLIPESTSDVIELTLPSPDDDGDSAPQHRSEEVSSAQAEPDADSPDSREGVSIEITVPSRPVDWLLVLGFACVLVWLTMPHIMPLAEKDRSYSLVHILLNHLAFGDLYDDNFLVSTVLPTGICTLYCLCAFLRTAPTMLHYSLPQSAQSTVTRRSVACIFLACPIVFVTACSVNTSLLGMRTIASALHSTQFAQLIISCVFSSMMWTLLCLPAFVNQGFAQTLRESVTLVFRWVQAGSANHLLNPDSIRANKPQLQRNATPTAHQTSTPASSSASPASSVTKEKSKALHWDLPSVRMPMIRAAKSCAILAIAVSAFMFAFSISWTQHYTTLSSRFWASLSPTEVTKTSHSFSPEHNSKSQCARMLEGLVDPITLQHFAALPRLASSAYQQTKAGVEAASAIQACEGLADPDRLPAADLYTLAMYCGVRAGACSPQLSTYRPDYCSPLELSNDVSTTGARLIPEVVKVAQICHAALEKTLMTLQSPGLDLFTQQRLRIYSWRLPTLMASLSLTHLSVLDVQIYESATGDFIMTPEVQESFENATKTLHNTIDFAADQLVQMMYYTHAEQGGVGEIKLSRHFSDVFASVFTRKRPYYSVVASTTHHQAPPMLRSNLFPLGASATQQKTLSLPRFDSLTELSGQVRWRFWSETLLGTGSAGDLALYQKTLETLAPRLSEVSRIQERELLPGLALGIAELKLLHGAALLRPGQPEWRQARQYYSSALALLDRAFYSVSGDAEHSREIHQPSLAQIQDADYIHPLSKWHTEYAMLLKRQEADEEGLYLWPYSSELLVSQAKALLKRGHLERCLNKLEYGVQRDKLRSKKLLRMYGHILQRMGKIAEGQAYLQ